MTMHFIETFCHIVTQQENRIGPTYTFDIQRDYQSLKLNEKIIEVSYTFKTQREYHRDILQV